MVVQSRTGENWDYDVLIVGGSLVGLTLGAWLGQSGLRVLLVEAQRGMAGAPSRVYALMPLTQMIWESLGVWTQIAPRVQPFDHIDLSDQGRNSVHFTPPDLGGKRALGHVAEHGQIWPVLRDFVTQIPSVTYWEGMQLVDFSIGKNVVTIRAQSDDKIISFTVGLLVGADGANSWVRQQAGIGVWGWRYGQSCLTTVIQASHPPVAYERFWPAGPLAVLPLPHQRWGIVWTLPHAQATCYVGLPVGEFLAKLAPFLPFSDVTLAGERRCFPVGWRQARRYVGRRLALVGDAAHGCHPVGGQGLNLGVRDAATLGEVLVLAYQRGQDVGGAKVLRQYGYWRWPQNLLMLLFTDSLNRVFSQGWWPLVQVRAWGLRLLRRLGWVRRLSLRLMAGLWGRLPDNLLI
jgi:2-octaprenyl-6-methoxyphenol hydroxylase